MVKTEDPHVPAPTNQIHSPLHAKYAAIVAGVVAIILYLSLFPFEFHAIPGSHGPLSELISTWELPLNPGHFVSNILLYMPLGFFGILVYRRITALRVLGVALAGAMFSFGIELTQLYIISRDSEMTDVYANSLGTLFGAAAGVVLQAVLRAPSARGEKTRPFIFVLLACWVGYRLSPYLPEFDPHHLAAAVRALFSGALGPADLYRHTVTCCSVCLMGEAALGKNGANFKIPGLILMVLLARTVIVGTVLSPAESAGTALGLLLWWTVLSRLRARAVLVA